MSDNEIYLLIKYIKGILWRVAKRLSYIEDARCLKVNRHQRVREEVERSNLSLRRIPGVMILEVIKMEKKIDMHYTVYCNYC